VRVQVGGQVYVNFATDDYLDLAGDPRLARAAAAAALRYGCGAGAPYQRTGYLPSHRSLERALTIREDSESVVVVESGPAAAAILVGSIARRGDTIFCDHLNAPNLVDGCSLSGASVVHYRHADLETLESLLRVRGTRSRRRLIVTETLFGAGGDLAPLVDIVGLAEQFDALVVVDESHATGVLGTRGRGLTDLVPEGMPGYRRVCKVASLNNALGSQGGFISGPYHFIAPVARHPSLITGGSLGVPAAAAARKALSLADAEPDRRRRALALADRLRSLLRSRGFPTGVAPTQIVRVGVGNSRDTERVSQRLQGMGLLVPGLRSPFVPRGTARLRVSLTAGHTDTDVDRLVECLGAVRSEMVVG
jgi:7-keto-8-aminopelargonate synthetase-like enzyme